MNSINTEPTIYLLSRHTTCVYIHSWMQLKDNESVHESQSFSPSLSLSLSLSLGMWGRVCVCLCVCEGGRGRERERAFSLMRWLRGHLQREREREPSLIQLYLSMSPNTGIDERAHQHVVTAGCSEGVGTLQYEWAYQEGTVVIGDDTFSDRAGTLSVHTISISQVWKEHEEKSHRQGVRFPLRMGKIVLDLLVICVMYLDFILCEHPEG